MLRTKTWYIANHLKQSTAKYCVNYLNCNCVDFCCLVFNEVTDLNSFDLHDKYLQ